MAWTQWRPYVSVAQRRRRAQQHAKRAQKSGRPLNPVNIEGRKIAKSFWGQSWCDNLEAYSDFSNRLPRGQRYVRNGSVIDLQINRGEVKTQVYGSELYKIHIKIKPLPKPTWKRLCKKVTGSIGSVLDLLQGKISADVMAHFTSQDDGLFPKPGDIQLSCSCPDWATMCKHVAASLYGVGARLDEQPELLFQLRAVDHMDLITKAASAQVLQDATSTRAENELAADDLSEVFGIDLEDADLDTGKADSSTKSRKTVSSRRPAKKKTARPAKKTTRSTKKRAVETKLATSSRKKVAKKKSETAVNGKEATTKKTSKKAVRKDEGTSTRRTAKRKSAKKKVAKKSGRHVAVAQSGGNTKRKRVPR